MKEYHRLWLCENKAIQGSGYRLVGLRDQDKVAKTALLMLLEALGESAQESSVESAQIVLGLCGTLSSESFSIQKQGAQLLIEGGDGAGVLYGVHEFLRKTATGQLSLPIFATPSNPLRMLNHWDNADSSIERGYAGNSFFLKDGEIQLDERVEDYARLVSSVGINGVVINNVNVKGDATRLIVQPQLERVGQLSQLFSRYGIKLFLSLNFAAPIELGGLDTADPLDSGVIAWWAQTCRQVYQAVPALGGFLVKADSEGRPGPFTYSRTHAQGANMLAKAVAPFGGLIIWRCFVYNCQQDWRDRKTDRARAAYDNFLPLDGEFLDNVILQIKNGPMDFQVREPVSPLFGALRQTNQLLEVQIAQEYTGQQRHVCYLIPLFKEVLAFKTYCGGTADTVGEIVSGKTFGQKNCGMAAVANTGDDPNWTGHDLAGANLYGFGRLAFDTTLTAEAIAKEWIALIFGLPQKETAILLRILLSSWEAYESYTSPLGIGWMVNPSHHFGPNVDGYEYDRWGTYHRADLLGVGVDRSSNGTGYATLYHTPNREMYEKIESCPEELVLFFHRVLYTHRLGSGKMLIQHIYDSHFQGASMAAEFCEAWDSLEGFIEPATHQRVAERLAFQRQHSIQWRDVVNSYFYRKSGIPDQLGRVLY